MRAVFFSTWLLGFVLPVAFGNVKVSFEEKALPLLEAYCYDCHGDGMDKGDFSMDEFEDLSKHLGDVDHWIAVYKNVQSQIMPPSDEDQLEADEKKELLGWIEREVFKVDPENPDPGRVTIRRLNRAEYAYAIYDLLGVEYAVEENFPADDTGYGFDTIGDVLTISPLHMERYLEAAEDIAETALPSDPDSQIPVRGASGKSFRNLNGGNESADWLKFKDTRQVKTKVATAAAGPAEISLIYRVRGARLATDQTAQLEMMVGGKVIAKELVGWDQSDRKVLKGTVPSVKRGSIEVQLRVTPKTPAGEDQEEQAFHILGLQAKGPMDGSFLEYPKGYRMLMVDGAAPKEMQKKEAYARKIMRSFVSRAFRRPLDRPTINRLVGLAMAVDKQPGRTFEDGIRAAVTAVLASPRFLFRAEMQPEPNNPGKKVLIDEYALASRLSFFLWSSVPDDELLSLAYKKQLRANLLPQVNRMLADEKAFRFTKNFVGQWLQARDVEHTPIDSWRVLKVRNRGKANQIFSTQLRRDMQRETELFFDFILKQDRPAVELINANYSFLNERLAKFYGINSVKGGEHRLIDLTEHPERGGVLTQGTMLVVTSNPTRTSPVKRGLFVLDQILGTPAPPAPPGIPELEEVGAKHGHQLTMREMMEIHRKKPACAGCHQRMDPIGLGLENFNAVGQFRKKEDGQKIDSAGVLVTGEKFSNVTELKDVLAKYRRDDFYRCLTEKLLTYAVGRGVEYYDNPTVDQLVAGLKKGDGTLKELVIGVIESVPFQQRRGD